MNSFPGRLCWPVVSLALGAMVSAQAAEVRADHAQEAFVIEQSTDHLVYQNDGTSSRDTYLRVRIQSDAGVQRWGVLQLAYDSSNEDLTVESVRVTRPDGIIVETPLDNVQDMPSAVSQQAPSYSDRREKHIPVKGLSRGDTLEVRAHWALNRALVPGQFWYSYAFAKDAIILSQQLEVDVPAGRELRVRSETVRPVITKVGDRRVYAWSTSNTRIDKPEDNIQKNTYRLARGRFPPADVILSTFRSWQEVGQWYQQLQAEAVKPDASVIAKAKEITKDAVDEDAKIRALYRYVGTEFRYIGLDFGIGRYQPHTSAEVLTNRYGDCKDKHTLLAALLSAVGIESFPALVNGYQELDQSVPTPGQFNHLVTVVPRANGLLWLDTTPEVAPFGYLLTLFRDKPALVIYSDAAPSLVTIPADPPFDVYATFRLTGTLGDDGTLTAQAERTDRTDMELWLRSAFRNAPESQWQILMENITRAAGFSGAVSEVKVDAPEAIDAPFSVRYEYEREDYGDWENRRIPAALPIMITDLGESKEERTAPYWLGAPGRYDYESDIEIPKQYQATLPDGVELKEAFAEYRSRYAFEGNRLRASRQLIVKRSEVSPGQYEAYRKFASAVGEDRDVWIDLEERSGKEVSVPAQVELIKDLPDSQSADARLVRDEALARAKQEDWPGAIEALTRATEIDPTYARAWWVLGQIYLSMQQLDHAIDALQHVIATAPSYPMAYQALATGLTSAKRYEEAVTVLQQLKDTAPDDPATFAQLGLALVQVGRTEEALQAIDKARELGASPFVQIGIAYGLVDVDGQRPLALELASSAVEDLEGLAAKIDLSDLSDKERVNSRILGMAWDVLGWVHFRMGQIAEADNYLTAAWTAMRDGEAAEHLGHVREAQGRKDEAIEMYALARAASPRNQGALEQLERLLGNDKLSRQAIERARTSLLASRRHPLPRLVSGDATAEFWLLFSSESTVKAVRFIEGSAELKSAEKSLRTLSLDAGIPKGSGASVLRRGHVLCYSIPGCELTLVDGSDSLSTLSN